LDIKRIQLAITKKTKCIVLCNPSNPTGTLLKEEELRQIALLCKEKNILIISDETYDDLLYEGISKNPILYEIAKDNYLCISSFSKNIALSGFRVGFVYANEKLIKQISKANDALSICAPSYSQYVVLELLKNEMFDNIISYQKQELGEKRELVCEWLDKLSNFFSYLKPEGAFYVFPKLLFEVDDQWFCKDILEKAKVALVPGSAFGAKGFVRISFAATKDEINEAFDRIQSYLCQQNIYKLNYINQRYTK